MAQTRNQKHEMSSRSNKSWLFHFAQLLLLSLDVNLSTASDTIIPGQSISVNQTLTSKSGIFELGFFTPDPNSLDYYIGIWYKRLPIKTLVWVANRDRPVSHSQSSSLSFVLSDYYGGLIIEGTPYPFYISSQYDMSNSTVGVLLDNGNFILRDKFNSSLVLWQSFDEPTNTWLPGMKIGYYTDNTYLSNNHTLTSWRDLDDPASGLYTATLKTEPKGRSIFLSTEFERVFWNDGGWSWRYNFSSVSEEELKKHVRNLTYVSNGNERYFVYSAVSPPILTRLLLDVTGQLKQYVWDKDFQQWNLVWSGATHYEVYAECGAFSISNGQKVPSCRCPQGFVPSRLNSDACDRRYRKQCFDGGKDAFLIIRNMHFPVESESLTIKNIEECELKCLSSCGCNAYAYNNRCLIWNGALMNLRQLSSDDDIGGDFHLRISGSEFEVIKKAKIKRTAWITGVIVVLFSLVGIVFTIIWRRQSTVVFKTLENSLLLFRYRDLKQATKNFSQKIGEGGFGSVFRGTLSNSTVIAVKKIRSLQQGEKQFRAEVSTLGAIQHTNLIRLRGFCVEASKRFLVFDYMPKGSLESHLFPKSSQILDWKTRYDIAIGAARGLAYLHEDCRDCIIHCDIKPENILLDPDYNPKVADFGLAKLIGRDFSRVLTTMRGTRGYLAPEWISGEAITPKVDVFSYGKLLCEIISGRRNINMLDDEVCNYFPARVAIAINKGEDLLTLLDDKLEGSANIDELSRACKVACWCIQDDEKDRPTMRQVISILEGVMEVGVPPIPLYFQCLADKPVEAIVYLDIETSSSSY